MSPTYTMSAHLCKQIYASWRQTHDGPHALSSHTSSSVAQSPFDSSFYSAATYKQERSLSTSSTSSSTSKTSMDSERSYGGN